MGGGRGVRRPELQEIGRKREEIKEENNNKLCTVITPATMINSSGNNCRLLTYLLTPWSRVLLEKLTGFAASQEIPRIYGTRKFITVLTSARHLSLS
jgi:hypothetical protein